jgi:hypothetical protein
VTGSAALLEQASTVLAEATANSNRAACWIARAALESAVDDLINARHRSAPDATMRSKLTVLQVAYEQDSDVAVRAEYAWNGLSQTCHHHAFQLGPTATEVHHLIQLVATLIREEPKRSRGAEQFF